MHILFKVFGVILTMSAVGCTNLAGMADILNGTYYPEIGKIVVNTTEVPTTQDSAVFDIRIPSSWKSTRVHLRRMFDEDVVTVDGQALNQNVAEMVAYPGTSMVVRVACASGERYVEYTLNFQTTPELGITIR